MRSGTVASGGARKPGRYPLVLLHPAGRIDVEVELEGQGDDARVKSAALVRTARRLFEGYACVPEKIWPGFKESERAAVATA